jgi:uncharacterized membrane protein
MAASAPARSFLGAKQVTEASEAFFEPQLSKLKLTIEDIESQSLDELQLSLGRINGAISNPSAFGTLKLKFSAQGAVLITALSSEATVEVNILPILLERKSLILQRISTLQPQEQLSDLRAVVTDLVDDEKLRKVLIDNIDQSGEKAKADAEKLMAEAEATMAQRERMMKLEVELQERRSAIWLSFLQRESVASFIGALLLLAFGVALIVSMFTHTPPTEVVTNAFLLILGYFFGQATGRVVQAKKDTEPTEQA